MKKILLFIIAFFGINPLATAADLLQVYQQALFSDPIYQQALEQRLFDQEGVPINRAPLFPQALFNGGPSVTKFSQSPPGTPSNNVTSRGYSFTLTLTQTVFDYAQFKALSSAHAVSKQADATLNAAMQDLMLRVSTAYFVVLKDEENLIYNRVSKNAFAKQYDQINQQFKVGLKTITDVDTAKASYDTASAAYIAADTTLANDKENLRAITGRLYPSLSSLSNKLPLISPQPKDMESWVEIAEQQNWSIKAAEYATQAARENIKQQSAGHLPTLSLEGNYIVGYNNNLTNVAGEPSGTDAIPSSFAPAKVHTRNATVSLNLGVPIFSGGLVVAQTNQARYGYHVATQKLEQTIRSTVNTARQSYLGIISGIQKIKADKQAIKSTISSLRGLRAGYSVGTQTLVDVLNQQQKVLQAETQYSTDRYTYVTDLLTLKQAAGTLSLNDLQAINAWLDEHNATQENLEIEKSINGIDETDFPTEKIRNHISRNAVRKGRSRRFANTHSPQNMHLAKAQNKTGLYHLPDLTLSP
jgi:outer membrane protein